MSARYVCLRCNRPLDPWPTKRADICSPPDWAYCIRQAVSDVCRQDPTRYTESRQYGGLPPWRKQ